MPFNLDLLFTLSISKNILFSYLTTFRTVAIMQQVTPSNENNQFENIVVGKITSNFTRIK